ncbi:MAG: membrane lipoprotein lipid attachment site-containing protein [Bacteroidaceae bacterium]|nr:membrane lipoprotein lipid attachment site-containing protein [Bacteroidaceae bacterium]MBO4590909.1 membrane lipoprotein lipid attachment site-containing protein [Bacteroidaceae bacterium]MBR5963788.1 membrane lipoprotein lipid attachment site-containing protein [Bacteroidaceae bacterium]
MKRVLFILFASFVLASCFCSCQPQTGDDPTHETNNGNTTNVPRVDPV